MDRSKPRQTVDYFKVGDKVTVNSFHNLFLRTSNTSDEFKVVGTVIAAGSNGVAVDWGRRIRYPAFVSGHENKNSCYWHLPMYLDKFDVFQSRVMEYVVKELGS